MMDTPDYMKRDENMLRSLVNIRLRRGKTDDLDAVNAIIHAAIMTWDIPERVKRLSLPIYRYNAHDLEHLTLIIAESNAGEMVGIATWEDADAADVPGGQRGLLLHGIYVHPEQRQRGIGSRLLEAALQAGREKDFDGLLVKANPDAQGFFLGRGLMPLAMEHPGREYPYRYWFDLRADSI